MIQEFCPQDAYNSIVCYTDSDHAGCLFTRKSTSGLVCMAGKHCLKTSSTVQSTITLSSGESEFYSIVKAASAGLGLRALYAEWHIAVSVVVKSDSSAARGMCSRRGLGKTRHVQTRYLWVQQQVKSKEIDLRSVSTHENLSDVCTKPVSRELCQRHMKTIGQRIQDGRSESANHVL